MSITPRERVLMSINHEQPDRVPVILGTSNTTSMQIKPYHELKAMLGITSEDRYLYDWPELSTILPDEAVLQRLHSDARGVLDRFPEHIREKNKKRPPHTTFYDDWGIGQVEMGLGDWFPSIHPLANADTVEAIESYPWPDMDDPTRVAHVREQARALHEETDYAVIGTPWLLFPFERANAMQRMDKFMLNMGRKPEFARALLEKTASLCKQLMGHFLEEAGDNLDIIKIGDDLGTQTSLMISPKMYRSLLKPIHADYIQFIKERTNAKVFFHTDGDVFGLIPDFIEIGVDILNPIQTSAGRMSELVELKKQFGDKLTFCGGVDTHRVLPFGAPVEVAAEVKRVSEILSPGGG